MNKRPVSYMQTDKRWSKKPYRVPGESATIGGSGCGPTCAAMLIETLTGKTYTPVDACGWAVDHGYKALNQGTYYSYFRPQFAAFGIEARQLNGASLYKQPSSPAHDRFFDALKAGYYGIACMGKGLWTSSGHFVVVWWEDGKVRINDPASTRAERLSGDPDTFRSQVKYYWLIDARSYNNESEEDDDMDISKLTDKQVLELANRIQTVLGQREPDAWSEDARKWAEENGIIKGDQYGSKQYKAFITREQLAVIEQRLHG